MEEALRFADPEGLAHELAVVEVGDEPLIADHPEVPAEVALRGFHAVCAYSGAPGASRGAARSRSSSSSSTSAPGRRAGSSRGGLYVYEDAARGAPVAGRRQRPPRRLGLQS